MTRSTRPKHATSAVTSTSTKSAQPATPKALPYVKAPPPITLPHVPAGVVTVPSPRLRAQLPRTQELELMPDVSSELARFDDYADVFGKTAPSKDATEQTLASAFQWSSLRRQLAAWVDYAQSQEVMAWVDARAVIRRLAPALTLAVKTDSAIGVDYPSLGSLFEVRSSIAKRARAVRLANALEVKEGRGAYEGQAGKRRKNADAKAALAARTAAEAAAKSSESTHAATRVVVDP